MQKILIFFLSLLKFSGQDWKLLLNTVILRFQISFFIFSPSSGIWLRQAMITLLPVWQTELQLQNPIPNWRRLSKPFCR